MKAKVTALVLWGMMMVTLSIPAAAEDDFPVQQINVRVEISPQITGGWTVLPNIGTYNLVDSRSGVSMAESNVGADGSGVCNFEFTANAGQQYTLNVVYEDLRGLQQAMNKPQVMVDDFNCNWPFKVKIELVRKQIQVVITGADGKPLAQAVVETNNGGNIIADTQGKAWVALPDGVAKEQIVDWVALNYGQTNISGVSLPPDYNQQDFSKIKITFVQ